MRNSFSLQLKVEQTLARFPWYASIHPGGSAGALRASEWAELPLLTGSLLEKHYYGHDRPPGTQDRLRVYRTSGTSSGIRKTIYYSEQDEERYAAIKSRIFARFLQDSGARTALSDMGTGHAADTASDVFRRIGLQPESVSYRMPIEYHLQRLRAARPHVLYTMPSILDSLLHASTDPAQYRIRKVILVGEPAPSAWIAQKAEQLGIAKEDILDTYGSIEIGTIASFSHEHGRYLFADGIEAEGVRDDERIPGSEELAADESVLVLTSAVRELFPALRFVTYDVVRDLRPILVNGELRMSYQALVRRLGPELKHGEKLSVYDIEDVVYRHLRNAVVRVQVADNKLRVLIGGEKPDSAALAAIERELADVIPEIGQMIRGRLLGEINVLWDGQANAIGEGAVKRKRIYTP
ncbi:CoF synthetase [Cohnella lubricantis]|uniref:CoF synthetase n=1 Tax=Cohnella lubricantis TaxID=2163172 RepID=A0A841TLN8_9BACL|nr:CoF synthetase [Cohnella lubricantis]MBB6679461.1 CoF synthetase [Cohnella lubricantis]MBP2118198.1 phenylacetate-coenzyme A ligase PaaK-like adenylate-forming protein [Cohnella lubricantis]